jgi:DNA-binding transcriptional MerR regulator
MTIAEVCKTLDMTADTLRYYERVGLIPNVGRTPGGIRNYTEYDCNWIEFIKCMRNAGVQVESLIEYVRLFEQGEDTAEERKHILEAERDRIAAKIFEMQQTLDRLNMKIERYEKDIIPVENHLRSVNQ